MQSQAQGHHPDLGAALAHLLSSGGKRVRPAVALLTGGMLGADSDNLITLAAAIELLHTATLVHDDLIDGAFLRRGIATINSQWSPAATVLTGDFIFARAAKLAAATGSVDVMDAFAHTLATIVDGEIAQLFSSRKMISLEDYYERIYAKTASMFELGTSAAAMLSPVDQYLAEKAQAFGFEIGMAFQIVDDVLDFTGKQTTVGKPVASDLRQGILTLPVLNFLQTEPDNEDIQAIIQGKYPSEAAIKRLVEAIRESDAIDRSMEEAAQFIDRGMEILADMPECEERQALEDLARYIVGRHL